MKQKDRWNLKRTILGPVVAGMLLGALAAGADEEIWKTIFRGTTEVNVVNVDVVVTDADGRPVTGLTKADFELFDGKQEVEISNFYEVANGKTVPLDSSGGPGTAAPGAVAPTDLSESPAAQPLHLILYVDNVNLKPTHRARVFARVREFLLAQRRLGARVMLVSNDRSLVLRQGFTSVPHELFTALDELEKTTAPSPQFDVERRNLIRAIEMVNVDEGSDLFDTKDSARQGLIATSQATSDQGELTSRTADEAERLLPEIQAYSRQRLQHTLDTLRVLRQLVDTAAGLPGRKSVLYVSDGLSLRPGEAIYEAYSRRFIALAGLGARVHVDAEAARDDATPQLQALLDHANAGRVTFYTLDASPAENLSYGAAESDLGAGGNFSSWNDSMASTEEHNEQQSLRLLAQSTGGRFGRTEASWGAVLTGVVTDFDNYYSLGFVPDRVTPKGGKQKTVTPEGGKQKTVTPEGGKREGADRDKRRLVVKVRGEKRLARHRSSFRDKPVATRTAERTRAALLLDAVENPFDIAIATEEPQAQDDGTFLVPISVRIPLAKLVLLPGEREHQGRVSMFVAVRDERGRTSDVNRHLCPIRIPNDEVLTALGQSAACGMRLRMRRGPQRVAVSVLDELTSIDSTVHLALDVGTGFQRADLDPSR